MLVLNNIDVKVPFEELKVSILVLMDVGLKPQARENFERKKVCFNPCFDGCWS